MKALPRRLLTVPAVFAATALLTVTAPLWLPVSIVVGLLVPGARSAPRVLAFITAFLWCEAIGIVVSAWIWLRHGRAVGSADPEPWLAANYALQAWWCGALKRSAQVLFRLGFEVEGDDDLGGDGVLMMLRHCSIGDTMIPVVFYNVAHGRRLRFVLKRELLLDPCLDIVGNRLPNHFADRSATDTTREVEGVQALAADLGPEEGVLIYPEGTRFTSAKRAALLRRFKEKGRTAELERARRWPNLLPPRPGGPLGLLAANPGRDVVFCAHTGFEGSADFARLFNGSWVDTVVRIRFWRVPFAEIPTDADGQRRFLYAQWDRMSAEVAELAEG